MSVVIITGSGGLIGAETCRFFAGKGLEIVGIDNNMRSYFFGPEASTEWSVSRLQAALPGYRHCAEDIRDRDALERLFRHYGRDLAAVIHTAAQPSHDWAAREPFTDFSVNALGTLNLLEMTRQHAPDAAFVFTSTNKVYGDRPNQLPLVELEQRWEVDPGHPYRQHGIDEAMSIDQCTHSVFGASKVAADVMVQEYGRYFDMKTMCLRGGCLTGPGHSGAQLHGFLAYLVKCALTDTPYTVFGYKGKQVRDNIHAYDLVNAIWHFFEQPRAGAVYNIGGGRDCNCSMLEAIAACEKISGRPMRWRYDETNRVGDHIWWISDLRRFQADYPDWRLTYTIEAIIQEIADGLSQRLPQNG